MVIRKPSVQKVASSELGRIALRKRPKETARKKPIEEIDQTHQLLWIRKALQTPSQHRFAKIRSSWSSQAFLAAQSVVAD
jgi:hypothetical protein